MSDMCDYPMCTAPIINGVPLCSHGQIQPTAPGSQVTTCDFCGHQGPPVGRNVECGSCGAISFHQAPDERPSPPGETR